MRRQILERQHITCGQGDDRVGIGGSSEFAKGAEFGEQFFGGTVVGDDQDEGTLSGAAQENDHQRFGGSGESSDTNAARALLEVGGDTLEGGKLFNLRENFADERQKHSYLF